MPPSGGIGVFSIQLLKAWGHSVVASCGARNVEKLNQLGCEQVIDYASPDFHAFLERSQTSFDVVLDTVGNAKSEERGLRLVRPSGHYLSLRGSSPFSSFLFFSWLKIIHYHLHQAPWRR